MRLLTHFGTNAVEWQNARVFGASAVVALGRDKKTLGRCRQALSDFVLRAYLEPARQTEGKTMVDATKQKFLVLNLIPASVMAD